MRARPPETLPPLKTWTKAERARQKAEWTGPPGPGTRDKFARLPNWVSHAGITKTLTLAEARIYLLLLQCASSGHQEHREISEGECYPTITTLAQWSGLHRSTVIAAVASLEKKRGVIVKRKASWGQGKHKTIYRVLLQEPSRASKTTGDHAPSRQESPGDDLFGAKVA
jgi:predicted transcriptional regulator